MVVIARIEQGHRLAYDLVRVGIVTAFDFFLDAGLKVGGKLNGHGVPPTEKG